jgi:hypothetical protein
MKIQSSNRPKYMSHAQSNVQKSTELQNNSRRPMTHVTTRLLSDQGSTFVCSQDRTQSISHTFIISRRFRQISSTAATRFSKTPAFKFSTSIISICFLKPKFWPRTQIVEGLQGHERVRTARRSFRHQNSIGFVT